MTIYAWPGLTVEITEARMAPIWIERQAGKIKRHFKEPRKTRLTKELTETVGWFVKLRSIEDGHMLHQGRWVEMHTLKADDGIKELNAAFEKAVGAESITKFNSWSRSFHTATELFDLIDAKEAA